jgi:hypothetical protein
MLEDMPTELFDKSKNDALELDAFVPDFGKKQQKRAFDDQYINKMRYSKRG